MTDFDRLYQVVKENEDINECPLFFSCGVFINTSFDEIDIETPDGVTVTKDFDDIQDLLSESGLYIHFEDNKPIISRL